VVARSMDLEQPQVAVAAAAEISVEVVAAIPEKRAEFNMEVEVVEPEPPQETRVRATRDQSRLALKVLAFQAGRPSIIDGECWSLTETSLGADLREQIPVHDPVLLQVTVPGIPEAIVLHAEFRHERGTRYRFDFVALTEYRRELLRLAVRELALESSA
jgi:hypothetical protein